MTRVSATTLVDSGLARHRVDSPGSHATVRRTRSNSDIKGAVTLPVPER
jgi:hypothetical protein